MYYQGLQNNKNGKKSKRDTREVDVLKTVAYRRRDPVSVHMIIPLMREVHLEDYAIFAKFSNLP